MAKGVELSVGVDQVYGGIRHVRVHHLQVIFVVQAIVGHQILPSCLEVYQPTAHTAIEEAMLSQQMPSLSLIW